MSRSCGRRDPADALPGNLRLSESAQDHGEGKGNGDRRRSVWTVPFQGNRALSEPHLVPGARDRGLPENSDRNLEKTEMTQYRLWFDAIHEGQDPCPISGSSLAHGRPFISLGHWATVDNVHHSKSTPGRQYVRAFTGDNQQRAAVVRGFAPYLDGLAPIRDQVRPRLLYRKRLQGPSAGDRPFEALPEFRRDRDPGGFFHPSDCSVVFMLRPRSRFRI